MTSALQRSKRFLETQGYLVAIVEKFNVYAKVRQDLFGIADLVAMKKNHPLLGVQVTTNDNLSKRIAKAPERVELWCSTGNRFVFMAWAKRGQRGKRKLWTLKTFYPHEQNEELAESEQ